MYSRNQKRDHLEGTMSRFMGGGDVEWVMQLATNAVRGLLCLWNKDYFILNTSCVGDGWFR